MKPRNNKIIESETLDCGGFNHLSLNGHYIYRQFKIQQFYVLPTQCVLCGSENKQRLFHCTALTGWFL